MELKLAQVVQRHRRSHTGGVNPSQFPALYQTMHGKPLDYKEIGFEKMSQLFAASKSIRFVQDGGCGMLYLFDDKVAPVPATTVAAPPPPPSISAGGGMGLPASVELKLESVMKRHARPDGSVTASEFHNLYKEMHGAALRFKELGFKKASELYASSKRIQFVKNGSAGTIYLYGASGAEPAPELPSCSAGSIVLPPALELKLAQVVQRNGHAETGGVNANLFPFLYKQMHGALLDFKEHGFKKMAKLLGAAKSIRFVEDGIDGMLYLNENDAQEARERKHAEARTPAVEGGVSWSPPPRQTREEEEEEEEEEAKHPAETHCAHGEAEVRPVDREHDALRLDGDSSTRELRATPPSRSAGPIVLPPAVEHSMVRVVQSSFTGSVGACQFPLLYQHLHGAALDFKELGFTKLRGLFDASDKVKFVHDGRAGGTIYLCDAEVAAEPGPVLPSHLYPEVVAKSALALPSLGAGSIVLPPALELKLVQVVKRHGPTEIGGVMIAQFPTLYKQMHGEVLGFKELGFTKLKDLLAASKSIQFVQVGAGGMIYLYPEVVAKSALALPSLGAGSIVLPPALELKLVQVVKRHGPTEIGGVMIAQFPTLYKQMHGEVLGFKELGFTKLKDLLAASKSIQFVQVGAGGMIYLCDNEVVAPVLPTYTVATPQNNTMLAQPLVQSPWDALLAQRGIPSRPVAAEELTVQATREPKEPMAALLQVLCSQPPRPPPCECALCLLLGSGFTPRGACKG